jgi:ribulose-5-phosphate 4-epimerase/fuculose-1-phosphate aldolase
MHFAVLKRKSAVCSVVHTHSLYATAMSVILEDELPAVTVGAALYAPTRIAPYAIPGSEEIAQEALKAMGDDNIACLLKFHGQLTAGASMRDAISAAEYIEENAQTAYLLYAVHRFTPLPYEDYKFLHDRAVKKASAGASPTPVLP